MPRAGALKFREGFPDLLQGSAAAAIFNLFPNTLTSFPLTDEGLRTPHHTLGRHGM